jgi:hypothetical protein
MQKQFNVKFVCLALAFLIMAAFSIAIRAPLSAELKEKNTTPAQQKGKKAKTASPPKPSPTAPPPKSFTPSEKISAGKSVSFPSDI